MLFQLVCWTGLIATSLIGNSAHAQSGDWEWLSGDNMFSSNCPHPSECGQPGVYGTKGVPSPGNTPGGRYSASTWTDKQGNLWLFGGWGFDGSGNGGYSEEDVLNDLWEFQPATNEWAWISGSNTINQLATYGPPGTPAVGNVPSARAAASSWTDNNGHLWLFGGRGYDSNGNYRFFNDLWEYYPAMNEWAWMGGSETVNASFGDGGVYVAQGMPAPSNIPGSRTSASTWTDAGGNLWLFGGYGYESTDFGGYLNDLWEYNTTSNQWTWISGSSSIPGVNQGQPGDYGTFQVPAPGNTPGGRCCQANWTDSSGNLWLFGGQVPESGVASGWVYFNDLWKFIPATSQWAWMGGGNSVPSGGGNSGVYGSPGLPAPGNIPGSRVFPGNWTDSSGDLWLYGGSAYDANGVDGLLNDLWEFIPSTNEWAWMGGSNTALCSGCNQPPVYGPVDTWSPLNTPGGRISSSSWSNGTDNFWLFSGYTSDSSGNDLSLNDLWQFQRSAAATPTFNPPSGTYDSIQTVTITDATPGANIFYTTDGSTPTTSSTLYTGPIPVSTTETVKAIAVAPGYPNSAVGIAIYNLVVATPVFNPPGGTYNLIQTVTITDPTQGAVIYCTTNGAPPTASPSELCPNPVIVSTTETLKALAMAPGFQNSMVATASYKLITANPVFKPGGGSYTLDAPLTVSISNPPTQGSTLYFTTNGSTPTTSSPRYISPITIDTTTTLKAIGVTPGFQNSGVTTATYSIHLVASNPTFSPGAGIYGEAQLVTLTSVPTSASIYYTTNLSVPTTGSTPYTGPIAVTTSETIRAIAVAPGYANSGVGTATYTLVGSPEVLAGLATGIAPPIATLNATLSDFGTPSQVWFVWGTSSATLNATTPAIALPASAIPQGVSAPITGLAGATTYYFQPIATSVGGTSYGAVQSFTTP